jgi:hypothetical protein
MKTALFTLAALFGLGCGLAVVGVQFGLLLLAALLAFLALATLIWTFADRLNPLHPRALGRIRTLLSATRARIPRAKAYLFPLLSALMGLALGAALARDSADLPAALLCGALAAALHLAAFGPAARPIRTPPQAERITAQTETHLARIITALAPCRDPHLHVAARALRREALALAAQVDRDPATQARAHRALVLWLPALVDVCEHLRQHCLTTPTAAAQPAAELTATLANVTAQLARLAARPDPARATPAPHVPRPLTPAH